MALNFELLIFPWTGPFKQERTGIRNPSSKEGTLKWSLIVYFMVFEKIISNSPSPYNLHENIVCMVLTCIGTYMHCFHDVTCEVKALSFVLSAVF
jgi:hypothetical protein